jgi:hypothetical protein
MSKRRKEVFVFIKLITKLKDLFEKAEMKTCIISFAYDDGTGNVVVVENNFDGWCQIQLLSQESIIC